MRNYVGRSLHNSGIPRYATFLRFRMRLLKKVDQLDTRDYQTNAQFIPRPIDCGEERRPYGTDGANVTKNIHQIRSRVAFGRNDEQGHIGYIRNLSIYVQGLGKPREKISQGDLSILDGN